MNKGMMLPADVSDHIYSILVKTCGAFEGGRDSFVYNFSGRGSKWGAPSEWRFQGMLGFGGKFWWNQGKFYVTCYREDETPKRKKIIEKANAALKALPSPSGEREGKI